MKKTLTFSQDSNINKLPIKRSASVDETNPSDNWDGQSFLLSMQNLTFEQERLQKKVFTRWLNSKLRYITPKIFVNDIYTELADGIVIITLLEVLTNSKIPIENHKNMSRVHYILNLQIALNFLRNNQVKLVNINASDLIEGRHTIILGLLWSIILRYQITRINSGQSAFAELKHKLKDRLQINVSDFGPSWRDGTNFMHLVHSFLPREKQQNEDILLKKSDFELIDYCFENAEVELKIPRLLEPEDVIAGPDEKSIMAYISQFFVPSHVPNQVERFSEELSNFYAQINDLNSFLDKIVNSKDCPTEKLSKLNKWSNEEFNKTKLKDSLDKIIFLDNPGDSEEVLSQKAVQAKNIWEKLNSRIENSVKNLSKTVNLIDSTNSFLKETDRWTRKVKQITDSLHNHEVSPAEYDDFVKNYQAKMKEFPSIYETFKEHYNNAVLALKEGVCSTENFPLDELNKTRDILDHINSTLNETNVVVSNMKSGILLKDRLLRETQTLKSCKEEVESIPQTFSSKDSLDRFVGEMQRKHKTLRQRVKDAKDELERADKLMNEDSHVSFLKKARNILSYHVDEEESFMKEREIKYTKLQKDWANVENTIQELNYELGNVDRLLSSCSVGSGIEDLEKLNSTTKEVKQNLVSKIVPKIKLMRMTLNNVVANCSKEEMERLENEYSRVQGVASIMQNRADNLIDRNVETEEKWKKLVDFVDHFDLELENITRKFNSPGSARSADENIENLKGCLNQIFPLKIEMENHEASLKSIRDRIKPLEYKKLTEKIAERVNSINDFKEEVEERVGKLKSVKDKLAESDKFYNKITSHDFKMPQNVSKQDLKALTQLMKNKLMETIMEEEELEEFDRSLSESKNLCSDFSKSNIEECRNILKKGRATLEKSIVSFEDADKKLREFSEEFNRTQLLTEKAVSVLGDEKDGTELRKQEDQIKHCISKIQSLMNQSEDLTCLLPYENDNLTQKSEDLLETAQFGLKKVRKQISNFETKKENENNMEAELRDISEWLKTTEKNVEKLSQCFVSDLMTPLCQFKLLSVEVKEKQKYLSLLQEKVMVLDCPSLEKSYKTLSSKISKNVDQIEQAQSFLSSWGEYLAFKRHFMETTLSWENQISVSSESELAVLTKHLGDFKDLLVKWENRGSQLDKTALNLTIFSENGSSTTMRIEVSHDLSVVADYKAKISQRSAQIIEMAQIRDQFDNLSRELQEESDEFSEKLSSLHPKDLSLVGLQSSLSLLRNFAVELSPSLKKLDLLKSSISGKITERLFSIQAESIFKDLKNQFSQIIRGKEKLETDLNDLICKWKEAERTQELVKSTFPYLNEKELNDLSNSGAFEAMEDQFSNYYSKLGKCERHVFCLRDLSHELETMLSKHNFDLPPFKADLLDVSKEVKEGKMRADLLRSELHKAQKMFEFFTENDDWLTKTTKDYENMLSYRCDDTLSQLQKFENKVNQHCAGSLGGQRSYTEELEKCNLGWSHLAHFIEAYFDKVNHLKTAIKRRIEYELNKKGEFEEFAKVALEFRKTAEKLKDSQTELEEVVDMKVSSEKMKGCDELFKMGEVYMGDLGDRFERIKMISDDQHELDKLVGKYSDMANLWREISDKNKAGKNRVNKIIEKNNEIEEHVVDLGKAVSDFNKSVEDIQKGHVDCSQAEEHLQKVQSLLDTLSCWRGEVCLLGEEISVYCPNNKLISEKKNDISNTIKSHTNTLNNYLNTVLVGSTRARDFETLLSERAGKISQIRSLRNEFNSIPLDIEHMGEIGKAIGTLNERLGEEKSRQEDLVGELDRLGEQCPFKLDRFRERLLEQLKCLENEEKETDTLRQKFSTLEAVSEEYQKRYKAISTWIQSIYMGDFENCSLGEINEQLEAVEAELEELYGDRFVKYLGTGTAELGDLRSQLKQLFRRAKAVEMEKQQKSHKNLQLMGDYARFLVWLANKRTQVDSISKISSNSELMGNELETVENLLGDAKMGESRLEEIKNSGKDLSEIDIAGVECQYDDLLGNIKEKWGILKERENLRLKETSEYEELLSTTENLETSVNSLKKEPITLYDHVKDILSRVERTKDQSRGIKARLEEMKSIPQDKISHLLSRIKEVDVNLEKMTCHFEVVRGRIDRLMDMNTKLGETLIPLGELRDKPVPRDSVDELLGYKENVDMLVRQTEEELREYNVFYWQYGGLLSDSHVSSVSLETEDLLRELKDRSTKIEEIIYKLGLFNKLEADIVNFVKDGEMRLNSAETLGSLKALSASLCSFEPTVFSLQSLVAQLGTANVPFVVSSNVPEYYHVLCKSCAHKMAVFNQNETQLDQLMEQIVYYESHGDPKWVGDVGDRLEEVGEAVLRDGFGELRSKLERVREKYREAVCRIEEKQDSHSKEYRSFLDFLSNDLKQAVQLIETTKLRDVEEAKKSRDGIIDLAHKMRDRTKNLPGNSFHPPEVESEIDRLVSIYEAKFDSLKDDMGDIIREWTMLDKRKYQVNLGLADLEDQLHDGEQARGQTEQLMCLLADLGREISSLGDAYNDLSKRHPLVERNWLGVEQRLYRSLQLQMEYLKAQEIGGRQHPEDEKHNVDTQTTRNVGVQYGKRKSSQPSKRASIIKGMIKSVKETLPEREFDRKYGHVLSLIGKVGDTKRAGIESRLLAREYLADSYEH